MVKSRIIPLLCLLLLALFSFLGFKYVYNRSQIVSHKILELEKIAEQRKKEIVAFLQEQKKQGAELAQNPEMVQHFMALAKFFDATNVRDEYKKEEVKLDQFFNKNKQSFNLRDMIFIRPDGALFYTIKIDILGEKNIFKEPYQNGILAQSFERVRMTLTPDFSEFGINPLTKEPSLYLVVPVFFEDTFVGAIASWIDETKLYAIIQNYDGLGKSGDIFVVRAIEDRVLFVAPSRLYGNIAFKKISASDKYVATPTRKSVLGFQGASSVIDAFGIAVIAAWLYVPQLDVGLSVGIQESELFKPFTMQKWILLIILGLLILCGSYYLYLLRDTAMIRRARSYFFSGFAIRSFFWIAFIMSTFFSARLVWNYYNTNRVIFTKTKQLAQSKAHTEAVLINQSIKEIESIAQMIARDLQTGTLKKDDIGIRISRDLKESPYITKITVAFAPFEYNPEKRLFALQALRKDSSPEVTMLDQDYMVPGAKDDPQTGWYDRAITDGAFWSDTFFDPKTKKQNVIYAVPFYQKDTDKSAGVIAIEYQLDKILSHLRLNEVGKTGYALLLSAQNTFIYHPLEQYVKERINLLDITKEANNLDLKNIAEQIKKGCTGFGTYYDPKSLLQHWIAYERIPSIGWTVATLFSDESFELPIEALHKQQIWIYVSIVLSMLFLALIISRMKFAASRRLQVWAILSTLIFAGGVCAYWIMLHRSDYQPSSDIILVRDQTGIDKYLGFLDFDAAQRSEQRPIPIYTGIIIQSLNLSNWNQVVISGYVWQKIKKGLTVKEGIRFPDAAKYTAEEVVRRENADEKLIGWNIQATFAQKHRFSWFPFDRVHINIILASADFEKNIVLVPDFSGYQSLDIDPLPGLNSELVIPGFNRELSFFSFETITQINEVGLETIRNVTENVQLHYNIILERKLTNPLIIYLLPLLIILFTLYTIFLLSYKGHLQTDAFKSISAYTALFFSLIILHQTLRNQYQAGELLYLEYFFFFTYVSLFILILHALLLRVSQFKAFIDHRISPYLITLFWPVQTGLWFLVTMIVFYVLR